MASASTQSNTARFSLVSILRRLLSDFLLLRCVAYVCVLCRSIGYSNECLGLHLGNIHDADLGDGNGRTPEQYLARQAYFPVWGTCWESVAGGHHFRAWRQNGTHAASGAWFIG